ncbi:MAG: AraC family transcriptional regulator [Bacteroidetes bacterium]|nr:AraC family transcriptional regulator [Fibrella sp.]
MLTANAPHTLSVASVNLILFAAQQRGAPTSDLIEAVGIEPATLTDPDGRLPIRQVQQLWREIVARTNDPAIALKLGELVNPVSIGTLAYVMMHCPTLGRAFEKLCQYQDIVCEGVSTTGRSVQSPTFGAVYELVLVLTSPDIIYPDHVLNSELSVYLSAIRAMTGRAVAPCEVRLAYPRPLDSREHERVFAPARLVFDAPETALVLHAPLLDTPILNANPNLFALFSRHADALLAKLHAPSLTDRVKREIVALLTGEEPTLATVADRLAMGIRTLQLHLKDEGTTYQQVLDEVRKAMAVQHLQEPYLSTTDIAYLLGFAEPSVFFRSFKKWTGETPGAFRRGSAPRPAFPEPLTQQSAA